MKRIVSISFVLIFGYFAVVHSLLLSVLIQKTKAEVFEQLQNNALPENCVKLSFALHDGHVSDPDFSMDEEMEFMYKGKMYDIAKQEFHDGKITYYCVPDEFETQLKELLAGGIHLTQKKDQSFNNLLFLIKSLSPDYCPVSFIIKDGLKLLPGKGTTQHFMVLIEFPLSLITHPPEV